jgi:tetratricopeptide (TPR) repeat protein
MRAALAIAALLAATPAIAAPKGKAAKAAFDRGVSAYTKGDFAGASEALGQSYKLEPDIETLFAWAQSERQQNKCDSAIELYNKLLDTDMPAENKDAVRTKLEECKAIIAAERKPEPEPVREEPIREEPPREEPPPADGKTPWWKDPIGDALTISGVVALGVGGYFLYSGKQAEDKSFENEAQFETNQDKAESHGRIGVILTLTGGALIVGGVVRYMTRDSGGSKESTTVTGWVTGDSGGLAAFGRF